MHPINLPRSRRLRSPGLYTLKNKIWTFLDSSTGNFQYFEDWNIIKQFIQYSVAKNSSISRNLTLQHLLGSFTKNVIDNASKHEIKTQKNNIQLSTSRENTWIKWNESIVHNAKERLRWRKKCFKHTNRWSNHPLLHFPLHQVSVYYFG